MKKVGDVFGMEIGKKAKNEIVIWGTGKYGELAYYYYKDSCNIKYYIDTDEKKWGKLFYGIEICPPNKIYKLDSKIAIVVAIKYNEEIINQLKANPPKNSINLFQVSNSPYEVENKRGIIDENAIIISFCGGLGNQMFQYALFRKLQSDGKTVFGDLEFYLYPGTTRAFLLPNVFPNIKIENYSIEQKRKFLLENLNTSKSKKFMIYREFDIKEEKRKRAELFLLDIMGGYIQGYHQSSWFAESIRDILLKDFEFRLPEDLGFDNIRKKIQSKNIVSVHVRRGDYLEKENVNIYGNICTDLYYKRAIQYLRERLNDVVLCFFSNDIEWVKSEYRDEKNAIFIGPECFDNYHDWYDMYLMSQCNHNIIANSTFSWWGAWLNPNPGKIVIAPEQWVNNCVYEDIYPEKWIKL